MYFASWLRVCAHHMHTSHTHIVVTCYDYLTAGDNVKFGLPMSASATTLLYGILFFEDGYKSAGQYEEALRQIRWPLDYFMKCFQESDRFYAQVGSFI
mgnify:FL=1